VAEKPVGKADEPQPEAVASEATTKDGGKAGAEDPDDLDTGGSANETPDQGDSATKPSAGSAPAGWYQDPNAPGQQRYWDGSEWGDSLMPAGAPVSTTRRSADERKAMLAQQVQQAVGRGLRIESQSDFQAVLVEGKPVNHTLHAILTIFTCLLWGIVWAVIAGTGGERREMIVVDEFGNIQHQKLGKV
jgi:uncharacterized protein DUF2510